jgi:hypothetical protein
MPSDTARPSGRLPSHEAQNCPLESLDFATTSGAAQQLAFHLEVA